MNEKEIQRLRSSFTFMKRNLVNIDDVADYLFTKGIIDWNAKTNASTREPGQKFDLIFDLILKSTKDYTYKIFLESLHTTGNEFIEKRIKEDTTKTKNRNAFAKHTSTLVSTEQPRPQAVYPRSRTDFFEEIGASSVQDAPATAFKLDALRAELDKRDADMREYFDEKQNQMKEILSSKFEKLQTQYMSINDDWMKREKSLKARMDEVNTELDEMHQRIIKSNSAAENQQKYIDLKTTLEEKVKYLKSVVMEREQLKKKTENLEQELKICKERLAETNSEKGELQDRIDNLEQAVRTKDDDMEVKHKLISELEVKVKDLLELQNQSLVDNEHTISERLVRCETMLSELIKSQKKPLVERDAGQRKGTKPMAGKQKDPNNTGRVPFELKKY